MIKNIIASIKKPITYPRLITVSLVMGFLTFLTAPPFNLYLLEFLTFIPGFYLFDARHKNLKGRHFFLYGYLFNFVFLALIFRFLIPTIQIFGGIDPTMSIILFIGYIAIMSIKAGLLYYIPYVLKKRYNYSVLVSFIVTCFLLESFFPEVLPYYFGNAQLYHYYFNQIADIVGVKGISSLVILVNYVLYQYIITKENRKLLLIAIIFFATYSYSILRFIQISSLTNIKKNYETLHVGVIQPNHDFTSDPLEIDHMNKNMIKQTNDLINSTKEPFDLMIWPESSVPFILNQRSSLPYVKRTQDFIDQVPVPLLYNALIAKEENNKLAFYSDAILHIPNQKQQFFSKVTLFPFGEYLPLENLFPSVRSMIDSIGNLTAGSEITNFQLKKGIIFTPQICYEITEPTFAQKFMRKKSQFIVNISNDKWFGDSLASSLHLWAGSFRAIENRVPIVRATNSGVTTVIDIKGRSIYPKSAILTQGSFNYHIKIFKGISSVYRHLGDLTMHLLMTYIFITAFFFKNTKRPFFLRWIK